LSTVQRKRSGEQDDGLHTGVSGNSGVANKLASLLFESLGFDVAAKLHVQVWRQLGKKSNFIDFRNAMKAVAPQFVIQHPNAIQAVQAALNQVGLTDQAVNDWTNTTVV